MNGAHPADHEELLMEVLTGQREPDDEVVAARLASCSPCREQLAELRRIADLVAVNVDEQAELLAAAAPVAGEAELLQRFRRHAASAPKARTPAIARDDSAAARSAPAAAPLRRLPRAWLAAAGLLIGATLLFLATRPPPSPPAPIVGLGGHALADVAPAGTLATRVTRFHWRETGVPSRAFVVEILPFEPSTTGSEAAPLFASPRLLEPEWTPSAADLARLPPKFRWRVAAEDAHGRIDRSAAQPVEQPLEQPREPGGGS